PSTISLPYCNKINFSQNNILLIILKDSKSTFYICASSSIKHKQTCSLLGSYHYFRYSPTYRRTINKYSYDKIQFNNVRYKMFKNTEKSPRFMDTNKI